MNPSATTLTAELLHKMDADPMKASQELHDMGQSLWLDNITCGLLTSGTLRRYIREFAVTRLTSNPTIFFHATWDEIGQLAAVIALRTILNFFLQMEIERSAPKKCPDTSVVAEHRKDA